MVKRCMRILTGALVPISTKRTGGTAVIEFLNHQITGGDADESKAERITTGHSGRFVDKPGKIVSMREFVVQDRRKYSQDHTISDPFRINDYEWNEDRLEVKWKCDTGAEIVEMSYMIVGEVEIPDLENC